MTSNERLCGCCLAAFLLVLCWSSPASATARIVEPTTKQIAVKEGGTIKLVCMSDDNVRWIAGGVPIQHIEERISVSVENITKDMQLRNTLTITKLQANDAATYKCKEDEDITDADRAEVDVRVTRKEKLEIKELNSTQLHIVAGDALNLRCVGLYRSHPTWYHNGKKLENDELTDTVINDQEQRDENRKTSFLTRENATSKFSGRYQCLDVNHYQSDSDLLLVYVGAQSRNAASSLLQAMCVVLIAASKLIFD